MNNVSEVLSQQGPTYYFTDAVCGAGKTRATVAMAVEAARSGEDVLYAAPTIELLDEVEGLFIGAFVPNITRIDSDNNTKYPDLPVRLAVQSEMRSTQKKSRECGKVLLTTHATLLNLEVSSFQGSFKLFVDEMPSVFEYVMVPLGHGQGKADLDGEFYLKKLDIEDRANIKPADGESGFLCRVRDGRAHGAYQNESFRVVASAVVDNNKEVELTAISEDTSLNFLIFLNPGIFEGYKSVHFLSANCQSSFLVNLWRHQGATFKSMSLGLDKFERHPVHEGLVNIHYLFERGFSKTSHTRDRVVMGMVFGLVQDLFDSKGMGYILCANKSTNIPSYITGEPVTTHCHGLNKYSDKLGCAHLAATNLDKNVISSLARRGMAGSDGSPDMQRIHEALKCQVAYQVVTRIQTREGRSYEERGVERKDMHIVVPDKLTADYLQGQFKGSTVGKLGDLGEYEGKNPGPIAKPFNLKDALRAEKIVNKHAPEDEADFLPELVRFLPGQEKWLKEKRPDLEPYECCRYLIDGYVVQAGIV